MKLFRNFSLLLFILLVGLYTKATTVTGTLLDPSFQVLSNAAVRVEFTPFPGSNGNPNINAILFSTDNLGAFSITLTPNVSINPSKSTYTFTICPNATVRCSVVRGVTITSLTTQDISTQLNTGIDTINVDPTTLVPKAYNDAELRVIDLTNTGAIYWNVLAKTLRIWDGSTWGQIPSTTNSDFLKLNGWTYTTGTFSDIQSAINYVSSQGGGRLINNIITPYTGPGFTVASGVEFDFAKTDYNPSSSIICVTGSSCIGRSTWVNNGTRIFVPNNFNDDMVKNEYDYGIIGKIGRAHV